MNFVEQKFNQKPRPIHIRWYRGMRLFCWMVLHGYGIKPALGVLQILHAAEMKGLRL